jgi:hypothetical protein
LGGEFFAVPHRGAVDSFVAGASGDFFDYSAG